MLSEIRMRVVCTIACTQEDCLEAVCGCVYMLLHMSTIAHVFCSAQSGGLLGGELRK